MAWTMRAIGIPEGRSDDKFVGCILVTGFTLKVAEPTDLSDRLETCPKTDNQFVKTEIHVSVRQITSGNS
jgi:hypothetical protein